MKTQLKLISILMLLCTPAFTACGGDNGSGGIRLNENRIAIYAGNTYQLIGTITPSNATNQTVQWSSDNNSIASVSSDGLVTGNSAGTAIITRRRV